MTIQNGLTKPLLEEVFNMEENLPKRIDKINYYLDIAEITSERSTCLKRRYGSIIVKNDSIISTRI